uniref:SP-RING-type domain-containing protein n=1 Tax=Arundo donax TaxID=35708 RepID=A0A0A8YM03_ARUDO
MEMNLRKPTWRCPYCNTPSNFIDLRIDQKMTKILQETGDDVIDVLVFADGSWKAASAHDEKSDRHTGDAIQLTGDTVETNSSSFHVIDLINGNDDDDLPMNWSASEDTKPLLNNQDLSVADYLPDLPISALARTEDLCLGDGNNGVSDMALSSRQNLSPASTSGLGSSSFGTLESILPQNVMRPVITDAVSPSLETSNATSGMQHVSQETHPEIVQLQPQIGPVRRPIPRNPRREPVGVQALPVPLQNPGSSRRLQPNIPLSPVALPSPASSTYQANQVTNLESVIAPVSNGGGPLPRTPSAAIPLHPQSTTLDARNTSSHLPSRVVGLSAPQLMGMRPLPGIRGQAGGANTYRAPPMQQTLNLNQDSLNTLMNQTALAAADQTTTAAQVRPTQADIQSHLPVQQSQALRSQAVHRAATPQAVPRAPRHLQSPSVSTVAPSTPDDLPELPVDENWRPTGQMRGSLTGNAYSNAIERYLGQAAQQQSQARPPNTSDARRPH